MQSSRHGENHLEPRSRLRPKPQQPSVLRDRQRPLRRQRPEATAYPRGSKSIRHCQLASYSALAFAGLLHCHPHYQSIGTSSSVAACPELATHLPDDNLGTTCHHGGTAPHPLPRPP